jgi:transcriptional regulator
VLHQAIRAHPLALLVSSGPHGLEANLIPCLLCDQQPPATLRLHLAKANPQVEALRDGAEVLVVFQGPHAYVHPGWYPSKTQHGRVVPTWNYVMVQVRGRPVVIDNPDWLRDQVERLTESQEAGRIRPWAVDDAPQPFVQGQLQAIVGVEIVIGSIEGKWKVSQNRTAQDRQGVVEGLRAAHQEEMAALVESGGSTQPSEPAASSSVNPSS